MLQQLQPESTLDALDVSFLSLEVVIDVGSCKQRAKYDHLGRSEEVLGLFYWDIESALFFPELGKMRRGLVLLLALSYMCV